MLRSALGYLAAADATAMSAETQAQCLRALEQLHAIETAARASVLAALASGQNRPAASGPIPTAPGRNRPATPGSNRPATPGSNRPAASGPGLAASGRAGAAGVRPAAFAPRAWLIRETGITASAATGHAAWVRRAAGHPQVAQALAEGHLLSESVARTICGWTDKLPEDCRLAADAILIVTAKTGANLEGLAEVFGGIYTLSRPRPRLAPAAPAAAIGAIAI
jgi:hypothetical protein